MNVRGAGGITVHDMEHPLAHIYSMSSKLHTVYRVVEMYKRQRERLLVIDCFEDITGSRDAMSF
jgi:hypothetical protein